MYTLKLLSFLNNPLLFSLDETLGSTACSGFGFYLLLFVIVNFGIAYKLVLKSFFFVPLIKALTPGVKLFRKIP